MKFEIPQSWRRDAACASIDPELFHSTLRTEQQTARRICLDCPVRNECLQEALLHEDGFGVWGGTLPDERRRLLARRPVVAA